MPIRQPDRDSRVDSLLDIPGADPASRGGDEPLREGSGPSRFISRIQGVEPMCGIVGIHSLSEFAPIDPELLIAMNVRCSTAARTAPDPTWTRVASGWRCVASRSSTSRAEISRSRTRMKGVWVVCSTAKSQLRPSCVQSSRSWPPLSTHSTRRRSHAYEEYGVDCVHKFRGMFAFGDLGYPPRSPC